MGKKLTTQQIAKKFNLEMPLHEVNFKTYQFISKALEDKSMLANEANFVANKMMGTLNWQGMHHSYTHYSGLVKLVNENIKKLGLTWEVIERPFGDGTSVYEIK